MFIVMNMWLLQCKSMISCVILSFYIFTCYPFSYLTVIFTRKDFIQLKHISSYLLLQSLSNIFLLGWTNTWQALFSVPTLTLTLLTLTLTLTLILTILTITIHWGWKIAWSRSNYPCLGTENIIYARSLTLVKHSRYAVMLQHQERRQRWQHITAWADADAPASR